MVAQPLHLATASPVHIHWGAGCLAHIQAQEAVVVLADRAALGRQQERALADRLGVHGKAWSWFQGGLASVARAQALCQELWPVLRDHPRASILAIGGGSTLDLAKVLRYRLDEATSGPAAWRSNQLPPQAHRHALWLVPTTAGTGSEVTRWATLWDTEGKPAVKLSWAPADGYAEQAWVDPELTYSCPLRQSRDCALDALAHALEALWNRHANPQAEAVAIEAAHLVLANLPLLLELPNNRQARQHLAYASLLAGLAMAQTQTALAHALSYELTLKEGLAHGEACAVWLPMVWELAVGATPTCDAALASVFGRSADAGAERLRTWLQQVGVFARDLRKSADGGQRLVQELRSPRGSNFIAAQRAAQPEGRRAERIDL